MGQEIATATTTSYSQLISTTSLLFSFTKTFINLKLLLFIIIMLTNLLSSTAFSIRPSSLAFHRRGISTASLIFQSKTSSATTTTPLRPLTFARFSSSKQSNDNNNNNSSDTKMSSSSSLYWNREESKPKSYSVDAPIIKEARILSLSSPTDPANERLHKGILPEGSKLLQIGSDINDFDIDKLKEEKPNVLFVSHPNSKGALPVLLDSLPSIEWIHTRSAGIDFIASAELSKTVESILSTRSSFIVTNAKGQFSSTLAEYTLMACSYFAKDLPRLLKQQQNKNWEKYDVLELRGATLGIIGYGDIGRATAKLASAYGMKIIALRRNPQPDQYCDVVYPSDTESLNKLFAESDYVLCSAPLTAQTKGMIGKEQFDIAKKDAVFINVGRGPIVDEPAMIEALKDGRLKGAGLDVFATEPLPTDSELWGLDNVLLSPHNMDKTATFMHEATEFFVEENLPRFLRGEKLLNPVDVVAGY